MGEVWVFIYPPLMAIETQLLEKSTQINFRMVKMKYEWYEYTRERPAFPMGRPPERVIHDPHVA